MDSIQLEKYRHDLAFLRMMADQAVKDFERFGYELSFNEKLPVSFVNYKEQLSLKFADWCKNNSSQLQALLYSIDVPEHLLPKGSLCSDPERMAELILQRELIKVVLRKLYSS
jgi:hypothetical protein